MVGANATYGPDDAPWEAIRSATHLHLGAPEFMGGEAAARILSFAREHGVVTSADILAPGEQAAQIVDWIGPAFEHLDYLLPNDEHVLALSGKDELEAGARALLDRGWAVWRRPPVPRAPSWCRRKASNECPPSTSRWSTPRAAGTPSAPASCAGDRWSARCATRPCSGAPRRRWWRAAWAPTTGSSTWLPWRS
ncbi:MAG: hypothetical protein WKF40_08625 [Thermoleophilaceae bacterium]